MSGYTVSTSDREEPVLMLRGEVRNFKDGWEGTGGEDVDTGILLGGGPDARVGDGVRMVAKDAERRERDPRRDESWDRVLLGSLTKIRGPSRKL